MPVGDDGESVAGLTEPLKGVGNEFLAATNTDSLFFLDEDGQERVVLALPEVVGADGFASDGFAGPVFADFGGTAPGAERVLESTDGFEDKADELASVGIGTVDELVDATAEPVLIVAG